MFFRELLYDVIIVYHMFTSYNEKVNVKKKNNLIIVV